MALEGQPLIKTKYLNPNPGYNLLKGMIEEVRNFTGLNQSGDTRIIDAIRGRLPPDGINTGKIIRDMYQFNSIHSAEEHFTEAQRISARAIKTVVSTLGLPSGRFGLKDEVSIADPDLSSMLIYTNSKVDSSTEFSFKKGVDRRLRYEQLRELFLTDIVLRLRKLSENEKPDRKLSELQRYFNKYLWEGPAGSDRLFTNVYRENDRGEVDIDGSHEYTFENKMRQVNTVIGIINVQTDFDEKLYESQLLKLISDNVPSNIGTSNRQDKEFDPVGLDKKGMPILHDRQRFRFIVNGGDQEIAVVAAKVRNLTNEKGDGPLFESIVNSPQNRDRGQVETWKRRYKASYRGIPIEILFYDVPGYLNSINNYGVQSKDDGLYYGASHSLYEIRRIMEIVEFLFPYEIYRKSENQTREEYLTEILHYAQASSIRIAEELQVR